MELEYNSEIIAILLRRNRCTVQYSKGLNAIISYIHMAVAGVRLVRLRPDQFSEERMHRNALSLSIEYTTRDTYN